MGTIPPEPALPSVLIVEDDRLLREILVYELRKRGYGVGSAESGEAALEELRRTPHDVVLLDMKLPGIGGLETLRGIRAQSGAPEVVLMTAFATLESAIEASRNGAAGYLKKPIDHAELDRLLRVAYERRLTVRRAAVLGHYIERNSLFPDFVGDSQAIGDLVALVRKVGASDCTVLVEGETGTGKELVARNIHKSSRRAALPFVSINCASLPEGLLESELFGHEKGAFTGATQRRPGLLEVADGGTLFLDEIGEMGAAIQAKFLRVLEDGEVRHVGGNASRRVDVRVVAATHRDMAREVSEGRFREDLFYRLNTVVLRTPSLRERRGDIPLLVAYFLKRIPGATRKVVSDETMRHLQAYAWPGNVRELRNTVERFVILVDGDVIEPKHLPVDAFPTRQGARDGDPTLSLAEVEKAHILRVLDAQHGNKTHAAQILGITKSTLYAKLHEYGVPVGKDSSILENPGR